ncbi:ser thr protein phosphatase [Ophiostoma piceae UAMH 11346]|uniref:Ser thr protein phosphatase n=1 Tax=Ophiostoma piceae (strain UAMH 11346) TaxID=1262450 RepID=S3C2R7_OPHP1|nr:ser thr protein phosphatase [Ophiostoma piceae UAMH 11346]
MRRTRIVCISDTHNSTVKLPKGDVLIHAGDLTNQGTETELARAVAWLEKADFECKIVVAGNHDVTLDSAFYAQHGASFHNQTPQSPNRCRALLERSPAITYLCHGSAEVRLSSPGGPGTTFTVFGSPYSPQVGTWAFSYPPATPAGAFLSVLATDLGEAGSPTWDTIWTAIPTGTDIVVTHTPALFLCDWSTTRDRNMGCAGLQQALRRVRPRLAICGHVHEGRGAARVRWDAFSSGNEQPAEAAGLLGLEQWTDPFPSASSKKSSAVNLTARAGGQPLDNNGSRDAGDRGRNETCVINCAVTATNYPHIGGKKTNKPIVVDIDLPMADLLASTLCGIGAAMIGRNSASIGQNRAARAARAAGQPGKLPTGHVWSGQASQSQPVTASHSQSQPVTLRFCSSLHASCTLHPLVQKKGQTMTDKRQTGTGQLYHIVLSLVMALVCPRYRPPDSPSPSYGPDVECGSPPRLSSSCALNGGLASYPSTHPLLFRSDAFHFLSRPLLRSLSISVRCFYCLVIASAATGHSTRSFLLFRLSSPSPHNPATPARKPTLTHLTPTHRHSTSSALSNVARGPAATCSLH